MTAKAPFAGVSLRGGLFLVLACEGGGNKTNHFRFVSIFEYFYNSLKRDINYGDFAIILKMQYPISHFFCGFDRI